MEGGLGGRGPSLVPPWAVRSYLPKSSAAVGRMGASQAKLSQGMLFLRCSAGY